MPKIVYPMRAPPAWLLRISTPCTNLFTGVFFGSHSCVDSVKSNSSGTTVSRTDRSGTIGDAHEKWFRFPARNRLLTARPHVGNRLPRFSIGFQDSGSDKPSISFPVKSSRLARRMGRTLGPCFDVL